MLRTGSALARLCPSIGLALATSCSMPEATFDGIEEDANSGGASQDASTQDGSSGFAGASGHAGSSGSAGAGGVAGAAGTGGSSGAAGASGSSGASGAGCDQGWIDCDGQTTNGCEVNASSDPAHCGSCSNKCPSPPNSTAVCAGSKCGFQCNGAYADCNGLDTDGCEVDTATDKTRCGSCDFACALDHASAACVAGLCAIAQCDTGFAACDTNVANGCEVSLLTDPAHCGECDLACPGAANADTACSNGSCTWTCKTGFADCDGNPQNGCEATKQDYAGTVLSDTPVAYYRLGEKSGPKASDATGHGHDGAYVGTHAEAVGAIACDPDGAAVFNPTLNTYITVPRSAALEPLNALTIELWFRQTGAPAAYQKMLWYGNPSKSPWGSWGIERQGTQTAIFTFYLATSPDPQWLDLPNLAQNTWHHVVFTYDGSVMSGYLNGAFMVSFPNQGPIEYDAQHGLVIGGAGSSFDLFSGELDEVAIYDKALSAARILAHYQAGKP